jgi:ATP-dependent helicase/nuclease subunit B
MSDLFKGAGPRVFNVAASAAFLEETAHALLQAVGQDDPMALGDMVVLAPSRRAGAALGEAIAQAAGGAAFLPTIRPLADIEDDVDVWGAEPIAFDAPAAIAPVRRRLELARLIRARDSAEGGVDDPVRALAYADELCRLLDSASIGGAVDWARLDVLVQERDFAAHWRKSVEFLKIITSYWPARLAGESLADPGDRRNQILYALARQWRSEPPAHPVVIVGSTGSLAATRALMGVVSRLPKGAVILPGLDEDLDDSAFDAVMENHPQFHLKQTLSAIGVARAAVKTLRRFEETDAAKARRVFLREAMAPAPTTADWPSRLAQAGGLALAQQAAQGLTILDAESEEEEAAAIALIMRETVETSGRTVALITPDASIVRRVEARLARWRITPQITIGAPLLESRAGRLFGLCAALLEDEADPITLAALLAHPDVTLSLQGTMRATATRALTRSTLRGPRRHLDLATLCELAPEPARPVVAAVQACAATLLALQHNESVTLQEVADAVCAAMEALTQDVDESGENAVWRDDDGRALATLLEEIIAFGADLAPMRPEQAVRALRHLVSAATVAPTPGGDPRVVILGPLEARVQRRDVMILSGLNEGVWPASPPEDAFLSRPMRADFGLPSPDARLGLAAHDFVQSANAPTLFLTRAKRVNGEPTVASRWLWRLRTLASAADGQAWFAPESGHDPLLWARQVDRPTARVAVPAPKPKPPAHFRPRQISFTEVETLIRDPYAVYARRVLGLAVLQPIGKQAGAAERGAAIHDALNKFGDGESAGALLGLLAQALKRAGFEEARVAAESARFAASVRAYLGWQASRRARDAQPHREIDGRWQFASGFSVYGRADRLDVFADGRFDVIDFKSGAPATKKQVEAGLSPQLTLEAAVAARGGFGPIGARRPDGLIYFRFGARTAEVRRLSLDAEAKADEALLRLEQKLIWHAEGIHPYLSKPRVQFLRGAYGDYDHLARRAEWADAEGEE